MQLKELNDLINVRQYVVNSTGNSSIDRATVNYMNNLLIMIDRKIIDILKSDDFKEYVNYKDVRQAIEEVVKITNIKSGLKK